MSEKRAPVVLIANDQEWTSRAVETILIADGFQTFRAHTAAETLAMADRLDPDVVILDQQLPDFSGTEVCRRLREPSAFGDSLPILITTAGPSGRQQRLAAYEAGAWEFYGQPLDAEALLHKLRVFSASYAVVRGLREGAFVDAVSGLYTRPGLVRRGTELLGEARRSGRAVACVAWRIPSNTAPELIGRVGETLRRHGRTADAFGRIEAARFAVIAPGADAAGADRLAARFGGLLSEVSGHLPIEVETTVVTARAEELPVDGHAMLDQLRSVTAS